MKKVISAVLVAIILLSGLVVFSGIILSAKICFSVRITKFTDYFYAPK